MQQSAVAAYLLCASATIALFVAYSARAVAGEGVSVANDKPDAPATVAFIMPEKQFRRALDVRTTAPYYLLVRVVNGKTSESRLVCVEPEQLLRAIRIERGLDRSRGREEAKDFALKQPDRTFRFSNPDAFQIASPRYTEEMLSEIRERVDEMPTEEVFRQITDQSSPLYEFCRRADGTLYGYLDAVAHVLMETGLACGRSCKPGLIFVDTKEADQTADEVAGQTTGATADAPFPDLSKRVPFLNQRLRSTRWQVRYYLLVDLTGRDSETKHALEILMCDGHEGVANQATVRYVDRFVNIEKSLFKPSLYFPGGVPIVDIPEKDADRALVDYCLGRKQIARKGRHDHGPTLPVLNPADSQNPRMYQTLTMVGILGRSEDAKALYPFLHSSNDYVALGAAKAIIRLGEEAKGLEALCRLTEREPSEHLYYVTEALHALREMDHPDLKTMVRRVLSSVASTEEIQPNWLGEFLLLAADVQGDGVWSAAAETDCS